MAHLSRCASTAVSAQSATPGSGQRGRLSCCRCSALSTALPRVQAVWAEYLCTLLFLYLTTGSVVFGCSSTSVAAGSESGSSGGQTSEFV